MSSYTFLCDSLSSVCALYTFSVCPLIHFSVWTHFVLFSFFFFFIHRPFSFLTRLWSEFGDLGWIEIVPLPPRKVDLCLV